MQLIPLVPIDTIGTVGIIYTIRTIGTLGTIGWVPLLPIVQMYCHHWFPIRGKGQINCEYHEIRQPYPLFWTLTWTIPPPSA